MRMIHFKLAQDCFLISQDLAKPIHTYISLNPSIFSFLLSFFFFFTFANTLPLSNPIATGPYVLESVELLKLSPPNQTCPTGTLMYFLSLSVGSSQMLSPGFFVVNKKIKYHTKFLI